MTAIAAAIVALLLALDSAVGTSVALHTAVAVSTGAPSGSDATASPAGAAVRIFAIPSAPPHLIPPLCSGPCPTPRFIRGLATWYDDGPGLYAAMPGWHYHQTPYPVAVCSFHDGRSWCVSLFVRDFCACGNGHVIDLSPAAFRALGWPLSRGVAKVTVERP